MCPLKEYLGPKLYNWHFGEPVKYLRFLEGEDVLGYYQTNVCLCPQQLLL